MAETENISPETAPVAAPPAADAASAPAATAPATPSPVPAPTATAADVQARMAPFQAKEQAATQRAADIASQSTAPPPPGPHARLLSMVQGLALGLDAFGKSIATQGREGGAQEVVQVRGEQQRQQQQAQAAREAQKNSQIQQQLMVADTNHKLAQNIFLMATLPDELTKSRVGAQAAQTTLATQKFDLFANTGMSPAQIDQLTSGGVVDAKTSGVLKNNAQQQYRIASQLLPADNPSLTALKTAIDNPNAPVSDLVLAGRRLQSELAGQEKITTAKTAQQTQAESAPFGNKAGALNDALLKRYQVLNPSAKALPAGYILNADSTSKDFDRVDKIMQQSENAQGTKANRDIVNGMRTEMLNLAKGAEVPGDTSKTGAEYLASLPVGLQGTVKAIGEGRTAPPPAGSRSPAAQSILGALNQAYPNYDASRFADYQKVRADFTSGKTSQGIASLNQVAGHLSRMLDHTNVWSTVPGLKNLSALSGGDASALNSDKQAVATELAKAYANGTITEGEINEWNKRLNAVSPLNLKANIKEIGNLLEGALNAQQNKWENGAPPGAVSQIQIISPGARAALDHITGKTTTAGGPASSGKAVSLAAAMQLPINKGKTTDQVRADIIAHGHEVGQ